MRPPYRETRIRAILLDIEGTTTPVAFVYDVLLPFVRDHVREFLLRNHSRDAVRDDLDALRREHVQDLQKKLYQQPWRDELPGLMAESASGYVHWLMDRDRKTTALKSLQGRIWESGFRSGELSGEVYPDVEPALRRWTGQGRQVSIFSSGSVQAQKLLFGHSTSGDVTGLIHAHFDTTTGPKKEEDSYRRIAAALGLRPDEIVFLSDVASELAAARAAGLETLLCVRDGGEETSSEGHPMIQSFDAVFPEEARAS